MTEPSPFKTGFGLRLMSGERSFSISVPSASALERRRDLIAELEFLKYVLDIGRESIEVSLEIRLELLLAGPGLEVAQREFRRVVEGLPCLLPERLVLVNDACLVERGLHVEHGLFGRLEQRIDPPQHCHGKDDVAVFAAHVEVAEHIVSDTPDKICDPVQLRLFHVFPLSSEGLTIHRLNAYLHTIATLS